MPPLAGRTKPAATSDRVGEIFRPHWSRSDYLFNYQLADFGLRRQLYGLITGVVKQALNLAPIVCVYDTGKHINPIFGG